MKKNANIFLSILISITLVGFAVNIAQLHELRPQLREEYISDQTVKLDGEIYTCGTLINNRDKNSLYCQGFSDGYNWATQQINIDKLLSK